MQQKGRHMDEEDTIWMTEIDQQCVKRLVAYF